MVRADLGPTQGLTYFQRSIEMLKKLLIPCLFVAAAIAINSGGCGSSSGGGTAGKGAAGKGAAGSTGTAGTTTGSAGSTAGATGSAGATAGATGSAGATAGATGSAGATAGATGSAGATAGATGSAGATAGSTGTAGSTTDGGGADAALPTCTSTAATSPAMSSTDFCEIFIADCGTGHTGYASVAACMTTYAGNTETLRKCQSYHLCNASMQAAGSGGRTMHCSHAGTDPGNGVCTP
jgi:hypothetical protein